MPLQGFALHPVALAPHLSDQPLLEAVQRAFPEEVLDQVIAATGTQEQRRRLLPARLVIALVIAMGFWARDGLRDVLANLVEGLCERDPTPWRAWHLPARSALTKARQRLGVRPLLALFGRVAGPVATPATPGAFLFGLRLMAIDGTILDLPDTPENARAFGRPTNDRGARHGPFPQARLIWLVEVGTHVLCDLVIRPYRGGEPPAARRLFRSITAGMLVMWDRGLHSYTIIQRAQARGAEVLGRVKTNLVLPMVEPLPDGSYLTWVYPSVQARAQQRDGVLLRVIEYAIEDPARPTRASRYRVLTSLLDPRRAPAATLAAEYHQRWEIEGTFDELKVHQVDRRPAPHVRSGRPREVVQACLRAERKEIYGLALAHLAIRLTIFEAATMAGLDPDRISFTGTLRILRRAIGRFQRGLASATPPPLCSNGSCSR